MTWSSPILQTGVLVEFGVCGFDAEDGAAEEDAHGEGEWELHFDVDCWIGFGRELEVLFEWRLCWVGGS